MQQPQRRVGDARLVVHDGALFRHDARVAALLFELADGRFGRAFVGIDEAGWQLDDDAVEGGTVLFLEDDFGACAVRGVRFAR